MTIEEFISAFGYLSTPETIEQIREALIEEIQAYRDVQGDRESDLLRICCMNLCYHGYLDDIKLIWTTKMLSMDTGCMIDIHYICGAGLAKTKEYLNRINEDWATEAYKQLKGCEHYGEFEDFDPKEYIETSIDYFKN